jgi:phosphopantothenoylcysteine decarboxylase/phosphopantothenate--cysteine ligase
MIGADRPLMNERVLLAVTGSVAACKADRIIRELTDRGAEVQVLLTESGERFFPPETAGSLTELPVITGQYENTAPGTMQHIDLKNRTDRVLVAPATANRLLNLENPQASDALGTFLVAFSGPVLYAPAMNPDMWDSEQVQEIVENHRERIVLPEAGTMACGETGPGRLADPERIVERLIEEYWPNPLDGTRCVISGGPTREPLDDVRHLTNRSSGKMGEALAKIATRLGSDAVLVTGSDRTHYGSPTYAVERVRATDEMNEAVRKRLDGADLYVGAAAVSDYRPVPEDGKIRSGREDLQIDMEPTVDIISGLRSDFPDKVLVGFSADDAETTDRAREKAEKKDLEAIVFNSINQEDGAFGSDRNRATLCLPDRTLNLGSRSKLSLSLQIFVGLLRAGLVSSESM